MVFSSIPFLFAFLPAVLLIYYLVPLKWRNFVLLVFSLLFYGWGEPIYVFVMIGSIAMDYFFGIMIEKHRGDRRKARTFLALSVLLNLLIFFFFKYLDFCIENLRLIPGLQNLRPLGITLPIGISFYTFQKMSYVIDVYRGDGRVQKNIVNFGTYISMFPQLIAGPIVKYKDIDTQLSSRTHSGARFSEGVSIFVVGLCKKVLLANGIGALWDASIAQGAANLTTAGAWIGVVAYAFQIYFDFSGYSDMAIGLGHMFGFTFLRNFEYPYISRSITEFWRRWHISLSTWFREYLYIPLGGNRVGVSRWIFNLLVVWMVTGLWHGAAWNFLLWGLYYAVLLILEKLFLLRLLERLPRVFRHIYALLAVLVGWAIFACTSLKECVALLASLFGGGAGLWCATDAYYLRSYLPMLLVLAFASLPVATRWFTRLPERRRHVLTPILVLAGLFLCVVTIVDSSYNPFLYFRF